MSDCIPDWRAPELIHHTIRDMVRQRVGQIACGYEDANDCDALRHDSALKMLAGRKPSDEDLCSQPTMTRLENHVSKRDLYEMGCLFVVYTVIGNIHYLYKGNSGVRIIDFCFVTSLISQLFAFFIILSPTCTICRFHFEEMTNSIRCPSESIPLT